MKININASVEMEFAEVMEACLELAAKKKVTEEVKTQVKQSFKSADLEGLNETLIILEHDNDYMAQLTWEQMSTHEDQLRKLYEYNIIDTGEWRERTRLIKDARHSRHKTKLDDQTEAKFEHLMGDDEIE